MNNSLALVRKDPDDIKLFSVHRNNICGSILEHIINSIIHIPKRILYSFVPPLWRFKTVKTTYIYIDIIGPLFGIALLISMLEYGYAHKTVTPQYNISLLNVTTEILIYFLGMAFFVYATSHIDRGKLKFLEATTMIGYSSYGCALTLGIPFFIDSTSDNIFLVSLVISGGSCGLRILMILLFAIQIPIARLLICSFVGSGHSLFLIYLYYMYMHSTFSFYINNH